MKRILIVDDESLIGYSLSASLRRDDISVKAVECGRDALSEINSVFYNVCFLDVNLPDVYGLDLMKAIKKASPATLIIIMTGGMFTGPEQVQFIQENAHLLISKPFDLERVKLFVDRIIGQERSHLGAGDLTNVRTRQATFENRLMDDKRKLARQAILPSTTCAVVSSDNDQGETIFTAGVLEISDTGMCIQTEYLLKPGQLLRFSDDPVLSTAVVSWSKDGEVEDSYHAGIQFIMPEGQPRCSL